MPYPEVSYLACLVFLFLHLYIDVTVFEWPCYGFFCPFPSHILSLKLDTIPRLLQHPTWLIFLSFPPLAETKGVLAKFHCFLRLHLHYLHHYHHCHHLHSSPITFSCSQLSSDQPARRPPIFTAHCNTSRGCFLRS